jgi:Fic family protein
MVVLSNRMPFPLEMKEYFVKLEKIDWVYTNMSLEGSPAKKEDIAAMINGELLLNMPIGDHADAAHMVKLLEKLYLMAEGRVTLNLKVLKDFQYMISGEKKNPEYRKRNIALMELDYIPILPSDIPLEMGNLDRLLKECTKVSPQSHECFFYATKLHNEIVRIMPFGEGDKLLARIVATYYMIYQGYPGVFPMVKEQDYNRMLFEYLKKGKCEEFTELLKKEVLQRMNRMIQLTAY